MVEKIFKIQNNLSKMEEISKVRGRITKYSQKGVKKVSNKYNTFTHSHHQACVPLWSHPFTFLLITFNQPNHEWFTNNKLTT